MREILCRLLAALVVCLGTGEAVASTAQQLFASLQDSVVVVTVRGEDGQIAGQGSGVIVEPRFVVTNCHVMGEQSTAMVSRGEQTWTATLVLADPEIDLCQIFVPRLTGTPVRIERRIPPVGSEVYAIGAPMGLELSLSNGLLAAVRKDSGAEILQVTTPISPGSSGGGLFTAQGSLLGITTFKLDGGENLNFAIPAKYILELPERTESWQARAVEKPEPEPEANYPLFDGKYYLMGIYLNNSLAVMDPDDFRSQGGFVTFGSRTLRPDSKKPKGYEVFYHRVEVDVARQLVRYFSDTPGYYDGSWQAIRPDAGFAVLTGAAPEYLKGRAELLRYLRVRHDRYCKRADQKDLGLKCAAPRQRESSKGEGNRGPASAKQE